MVDTIVQTKGQPDVCISYVALSNTDYSVLKVASGILAKNHKLPNKLLERHDTTGNIVLVDMDTPEGQLFYESFDYARNRLLLLLSQENVNDQRNYALKKPIRVQTLKDMLQELCLDLQPKPLQLSTKPEVSEGALSPLSSTPQTDPEKLLFFILVKARAEREVAQIFCPPHSPIYVNALEDIVATSASRDVLRRIIQDTAGHIKSTRISASDFEVLAKGQRILPLSHVLWSAALFGSQKHLMDKHSADSLVQLKAWPNFSRLEFEPMHMKLASMMASQPSTLQQIQERTQLPWEFIVGFFNATCAAGLINSSPVELPQKTRNVQKPVVKAGLLAKIAQRLKLAS